MENLGARGEWYVVVQLALFALVAFGPRTLPAWPEWVFPFTWPATIVGGLLIVVGIAFAGAGAFSLREGLTPLPYPKEGARLIESGPYRIVRHPIYSGVILVAFGWALAVHGSLTLVYALALFVFLDLKSRREERWLNEKFPHYADYAKRVRKLLPFVY